MTDKHGHWIDIRHCIKTNRGTLNFYECSVCGRWSGVMAIEGSIKGDFCPWCGAKMNEEKKYGRESI